MSAITALTAQNTSGVSGIAAISAAFVAEQIDTTVEDIPPDAVKTGMLASREIVEIVAGAAQRHRFPNLVVDPVVVATTGAILVEQEAVQSVLDLLVPLAAVLTPNAAEAAALLARSVSTPSEQVDAARALVEEHGATAVLVKGGDIPGDEIADVYFAGGEPRVFRQQRIATSNTHGSGCVLASAIAAYLARGEDQEMAIERARAFVLRAIERAPDLGRGRGPLNLFV